MTDKSCAKINASLAKAKGWLFEKGRTRQVIHGGQIIAHVKKEWLCPGTKVWRQSPPDFCGDWNLAGPEYTRMLDDGLIVEVQVIESGYKCSVYRRSPNGGNDGLFRTCVSEGKGSVVEEAIARAAEAMLEEKAKC